MNSRQLFAIPCGSPKCTKVYRWALLCLLCCFVQAQAKQWGLQDQHLNISWDNALSYGATWRIEDQDAAMSARGDFTALARRAQINKNDGNQNFNKGLAASVLTWTTEIDGVWHDRFGFFVRGVAFFDEVIMRGFHDGGRVDQFENSGCGLVFCQETQDEAGAKAEFLDAYIWGHFNLGQTPLTLRLGHQVLQWGEALFLQDGVNQINPASLASLRRPGAELKEALIPLPMIFAQTELTTHLSMEAFYLFDWQASRGDAVGTFLSTNDAFAGEGARAIYTDLKGSSLEAVVRAYNGFAEGIDNASDAATRLKTDRLRDQEPGGAGQFGVAFRYFAEQLNSTEFGFYYLQTHAKKQTAGIVLGEANAAIRANSAACRTSQALIASLESDAPGVDCNQLTPAGLAGAGYSTAEIASALNFIGGANAAHYIDTTQYFLNYEQDQEVFGLSFNTLIGATSVAGEIAYRKDALFLAELGDNLVIYNALAAASLANGAASTQGQFGPHVAQGLSAGDIVLPNAQEDMINMSVMAIHAFGPNFALDELNGVFEVGLAYVAGLDDKLYAAQDAMSYLAIPGIAVDGHPSQYLSRSSWGVRFALLGAINNAFQGVSLRPSLRYAHDVEGNSVLGGNFVEGRQSVTLGLGAVYNFNWELKSAITSFFGAADRNQIQDRDHLAISLEYIF